MKTLLMVPTLNEAASIKVLLNQLGSLSVAFDVLIVDDSSTDGTQEIVWHLAKGLSREIFLIEREFPLNGLAGAYLVGYRFAFDNGYTHIVQMDADGQHQVSDLANLIEVGSIHSYVIGSRYCPGGKVEGWTLFRLWISKLGNFLFRLLHKPGVKDATGGFRMSEVILLNNVWDTTPTSRGFTFHAESTMRVKEAGIRIVETPITFISRQAGDSKMSLGSALESLKLMIMWKLVRRHAN